MSMPLSVMIVEDELDIAHLFSLSLLKDSALIRSHLLIIAGS